MVSRAAAALAYVPVPGLSFIAAWSHPTDRLTRFHARQATWVVLAGYAVILVVGFGGLLAPGATAVWSPLAAIALGLTLVACIVGAVGAARGRFTRVRPYWDFVAR